MKTQISLGIRPVWSESLLCAQWVAKDPSFLHVDCKKKKPDQTGQMPRLIWVFAGRTYHFVGFVMRWLIFVFTGDSSAETAIQKAIDEVNGRIASGEGLVNETEEGDANQSAIQSGKEEGQEEQKEEKKEEAGEISWYYNHWCLALWIKFSADDILKCFSYFSQKTGFNISCKLSPLDTICMKCWLLFSGQKKENVINL